jgi:hypothetical protein
MSKIDVWEEAKSMNLGQEFLDGLNVLITYLGTQNKQLIITDVVNPLCWNKDCNNPKMDGHIACKECHKKVVG